MKFECPFVFFFLAAVLYTSGVIGQSNQLSFNYLGTDEGLSNTINSYVFQDSRGFIWISSLDGLNRYDGSSVITYRPGTNPGDLSGNIISSPFFEDAKGNIWFTTYGGVHQYSRVRDHFINYSLKDQEGEVLSEDYRAFHLDSAGFLWIRTGLGDFGLMHKFDIGLGRDEIIGPIAGRRNYLIAQDGTKKVISSMLDGRVGVQILELRHDSIISKESHLLKSPQGRMVEAFNLAYEGADVVYIGTSDGLGIFSLTDFSFELISTFQGQPLERVWSIVKIDQHILLVTSSLLGLLAFDLSKQMFIHDYDPFGRGDQGFVGPQLREATIDRSGNIWLSMWGKGLAFANLSKNKLDKIDLSHHGGSNDLVGLEEDQEGNVWAATERDGIFIFDGRFELRQRVSIPEAFGKITLTLFKQLSDGSMVVVGIKDEMYQLFLLDGDVWENIGSATSNVFDVHLIDPFNLLLACGNGLFRKKIKDPSHEMANVFDSRDLRDLPFYRIYEDRFGRLYFASNFDRIIICLKELNEISLQKEMLQVGDVKDFCPESDSTILAASSKGLLQIALDDLDHRFIMNQSSGLISESFFSVHTDRFHCIWLKTQNSIVKYDPQSHAVQKFTISDGVQQNDGTRITSLRTQRGHILLEGPQGITLFHPDSIPFLQAEAQAQITSIYINDQLYQGDTFASELHFLPLSYADNTISFDFVACEYSDPMRNNFRYRMVGLDDDWVASERKGFARYPNLNWGKYQFKVQAANSDGAWSEEPAQIEIHVAPPWWGTWWAKGAYGLFGLGILLLLFRWRTQRQREKLLLRERELEQEKKVNERLRQVDQLKDQFLANTSHELRTPLNGIIGLAESLIDGATGPLKEETQENLSMIASSSKRLAHLVDDLLDFSRMKNEDLKLILKSTDLHSVSELVVTLLQPLISGKALTLENAIPRNFPYVLADENRLQQVLYNLLGNGIKFTEQGHVRLSASEEDGMIRIAVEDTGIGIPMDKITEIFGDFIQGDGSVNRSYAGTGLGLSITKKLVELQGGKIWVDSAVGGGSTFYFTLPRAADESTVDEQVEENAIIPLLTEVPATENASESTFVTHRTSDIRVLVVDDEAINLKVLENHLTLGGYQVVTISNGQGALDLFARGESFDLVLLDIMMPKMSGLEVCQRLREKYLPSELPIIMLTAKNQISDMVEGFDAGANDYLRKPFSKDELMSRLKTHLRLHKIHQATGKFVPYEFLHSIGRDEITEVQLGDFAACQDVGVLFADIRSYTSLAEEMTPEENFRFVNAVVGRMGPIIEKNQGFVEQYLGDAVMALFPKSPDDLLSAAVELQLGLQSYNKQRKAQGRAILQVGTGVHTGPLIMGIIGHANRTNTAVIADTVNLAARFEGLTKHYGARIMVSEDTVKLLQSATSFNLRYLGKVQVKGKEQVIGAYECIDGDLPEVKVAKMETLSDFKVGVTLFVKGDFDGAADRFTRVINRHPADAVARRFLKRAGTYSKRDHTFTWTGVEMMQTK